MMPWQFMAHGAGFGFMGIVGMLFFAFFAVLGITLLRKLWKANGPNALSNNEPLNVLKIRLARGEISPDQYEELRAHLQ
jgi:uncharacterized membrane protein